MTTVTLIRGHRNKLFERAPGEPVDTVSWDPDESGQHDTHTALHPGCAKCVIGTGDWKLLEPESKAELEPPAPVAEEG
jgi:hypothetical protein